MMDTSCSKCEIFDNIVNDCIDPCEEYGIKSSQCMGLALGCRVSVTTETPSWTSLTPPLSTAILGTAAGMTDAEIGLVILVVIAIVVVSLSIAVIAVIGLCYHFTRSRHAVSAGTKFSPTCATVCGKCFANYSEECTLARCKDSSSVKDEEFANEEEDFMTPEQPDDEQLTKNKSWIERETGEAGALSKIAVASHNPPMESCSLQWQ